MKKVLIVEDDPAMTAALTNGLRFNGYDVVVAHDGVAGLRLAAEEAPDVVVLDVMLPRMDGLDVCRRLREQRNRVPVLMLTARGQEMDKVTGLRTGADDYLTKPFSFLELLARIEALIRRADPAADLTVYAFDDVWLDFDTYAAKKGGEPLALTHREFEMLRYFVARRGQVVTREQLLGAVWGALNPVETRTVDVHIAKLRRKLGEVPSKRHYILTVPGGGYKFVG